MKLSHTTESEDEQQNIQKRNDIIEEYIKCLDNKPSVFDCVTPRSEKNNDDQDDPFASPIPNSKEKPKIKEEPKTIISEFQNNNINLKRPAKSSLAHKKLVIPNNKIDSARRDPFRPSTRGTSYSRSPINKNINDKLNKKRNNTAKTISKTGGVLLNINGQLNSKYNRIKTTKREYKRNIGTPQMNNKRIGIRNDFLNRKNGWAINCSPLKRGNGGYNGYNNIYNGYNNFTPNQYNCSPYFYNINYLEKSKVSNKANKSFTKKQKEKLPEISKKKLKEKLNQIKANENKESDELPKDILEQFSTNRKNFYQIRKDIPEEDDEYDVNESEEENKNNYIHPNNKKGNEIVFPVIFKYFKDDKAENYFNV
ncbi:MAG: hypothetical protein MJ252_26575 [archaeon]|nr:hypothetical protein [archaeon]